jgi:Uma2 family endonuclease
MGSKGRPASYEDLVQLPDDRIGEIVGGELYASPRPRPRHSHAAVRLIGRLASHFDDAARRDRWWFLFEPELHLGDDVLVPDLAAWRTPVPIVSAADSVITVSPDWVCEILSPSTETLDVRKKLPAYAGHGVGWLWLVDPARRTLDSFIREGRQWRSLGTWTTSARLTAAPFDELEIDLGQLWLT